MTRLDRLILSEIVGPFVGSAVLFTGLFFAAGEFVRILQYIQQGVPLGVIGHLLALTLPGVIALTFPVAILLAALQGMGRLSGDSELTAIVGAGVSFERVMVPVAAFALLVSFTGVWFNNSVVPAATRGRQEIIDNLKNNGASAQTGTGFAVSLRGDRNMLKTHVVCEGGVDLASGSLSQVSVETWDNGRVVAHVYANRAKWTIGTAIWTLSDDFYGAYYNTNGEVTGFSGASGDTREYKLGTPAELAALERPVDQASTSNLQERVRIFQRGGDTEKAREAQVEVGRRLQLPFASLVFALIGAALGVRSQRAGRGVGFGLSVIISFLYWIALQFVSILGRGGTLPPTLALALPNLLGVALGIYLIRRVLR